MLTTYLLALLLAGVGRQTPAAQTAPQSHGLVLQTFDFKGIRLDDGPLKEQVLQAKRDYLAIPNDDLLKGFRQRAKKPAPGVDLGGWYTSDTFNVFGQILSGLARLYAATGDIDCRTKAFTLLREWAACIEPDGYFYYTRLPNAPHYTYDKMVGGLVDLYHYCGSREAIPALEKITDWAEKNLDRARPYGADTSEWYTLSENLYRAYLYTGDTRYRDFAKVWEYNQYWDRYAHHEDLFGPGPDGKQVGGYHAYSHVNTLGGAGVAYLVTGEKQYLETITNAYDVLQKDHLFVTGGYGPDETLSPPADRLNRLRETHNTFETQCGSWAAFKLVRYLITVTGDAGYGDWAERLIVNGIGASIPMSPDGRVFYYSDYNPGGAVKRNVDFGWSCCSGTRPIALSEFANLVYYHDADGLYVNLYTPSTLRWKPGRQVITLSQKTRFPESETSEFTLNMDHAAKFALNFRVPRWLASDMEVAVNGEKIAKPEIRKRWFYIDRAWRDGDRITVKLPMKFTVRPIVQGAPQPEAILYGPVVMAVRSPGRNPARKFVFSEIEQSLEPLPGEPLTFRLASNHNVLIRPFYTVKEGELYYLYLDPSSLNSISYRDVTFSPNWRESSRFRFTNIPDATAEATFEGTGVRWLGNKYDDAGKAEVSIDGKVVAVVDQYGPGRDLPFVWDQKGLPAGKHTIRVRVTTERNAESKDHYINVAGFAIYE